MWPLLFACVPRLYTTGDSDTDTVAWTAPDNDWGVTEPPIDLVATGWSAGETVPDIRLIDQHGETVSLWQFYGKLVLVDVCTMWCAPCRDLATHTEAEQLEFGEQGFVYETVISEDIEGNPPDVEDLGTWADTFGIVSAPVVSDATHEIATTLTPEGAFPVIVMVGRDLTVLEVIIGAPAEGLRPYIEAHLE